MIIMNMKKRLSTERVYNTSNLLSDLFPKMRRMYNVSVDKLLPCFLGQLHASDRYLKCLPLSLKSSDLLEVCKVPDTVKRLSADQETFKTKEKLLLALEVVATG